MGLIALGKVAVPTPGTPVRVTANPYMRIKQDKARAAVEALKP